MIIGVLGLGSIGMRHAKNLLAMGHEVIAYDPSVAASSEFEREGGKTAPREEVFAKVDALVVATPTSQHWQDLLDTIDRPVPIFVEKPVADQKKNLRLTDVKMVGYMLRFHNCVRMIKETLAEGIIGKPLWSRLVCAQYNDKPDYLRDGVILNWSHEIDLALYLFGKGSLVGSYATKQEDLSSLIIEHNAGCLSSVHIDYLTRAEQRTIEIVGTEGRIDSIISPLRYVAITRWGGTPKPFHLFGSYDEDYKTEMKAFLDRIDGKQTFGATAEEALDVLDICLETKRRAQA